MVNCCNKYKWVLDKEALDILSFLVKKYPKYFTKEACEKREWKKKMLLDKEARKASCFALGIPYEEG